VGVNVKDTKDKDVIVLINLSLYQVWGVNVKDTKDRDKGREKSYAFSFSIRNYFKSL
jgi:hypothetical protein